MTALAQLISIPPRNTDDRAWQAHIEAKAAEWRRHEALLIEAQQAAMRPVKVERPKRVKAAPKPREPRQPRVYVTRPAAEKVIPCTSCGHPTRANKYPAADFPGTRPRRKGGRCTSCEPRVYTVQRTFKVDTAAILAAHTPQSSLTSLARDTGYARETVRRVLLANGIVLSARKAVA